MTEVADINIRELASLAGVSIATVSRVINNPQLVQPDTREHVLEVMRRVNYAPAWTVESRLSSRSRLIAFLFSEADYYFYSDIRSGLESIAGLRGYTVLRILKDFGDKNGERNVFNYFAAGWNRDGLALRGAGDTLVPSLLNLGSIWIVRLGLSLLLVGKLGLRGMWIAMAIELCVRGTLMLWRQKTSKFYETQSRLHGG